MSPGCLEELINAGVNDWGGVSPLTPDHVNPEAPWPHLDKLSLDTKNAGKVLHERLTIYPKFVLNADKWVDSSFEKKILDLTDSGGYPRVDGWSPGEQVSPPAELVKRIYLEPSKISTDIKSILARAKAQEILRDNEIARLFESRGDDFNAVCRQANSLREEVNGSEVSFVVNRNINYTNVCYFKCQFCAFSKGKLSENLRGKPYDLDHNEIARRVTEAWERGGTEVCMQGLSLIHI